VSAHPVCSGLVFRSRRVCYRRVRLSHLVEHRSSRRSLGPRESLALLLRALLVLAFAPLRPS